jgi:hypothetical protein
MKKYLYVSQSRLPLRLSGGTSNIITLFYGKVIGKERVKFYQTQSHFGIIFISGNKANAVKLNVLFYSQQSGHFLMQ